MNSAKKFSKLLESTELKHLRLKNRFVKAAYSSTTADDRGCILDAAVYHYDAVASGGVGLFLTESVALDKGGMTGTPRMAIWDDSFIPGQKNLLMPFISTAFLSSCNFSILIPRIQKGNMLLDLVKLLGIESG